MIFEKDEILELNNNKEYFVANKIIYNNYSYALLVNINEDNDYFVVKQKNNMKLVRENNKEIIDLLKEYL